MKKSYVKPVLNSSMEGTLEGVYAYGNQNALGCTPSYNPCQPQEKTTSSNEPNESSEKNNGGGQTYFTFDFSLFIEWWYFIKRFGRWH